MKPSQKDAIKYAMKLNKAAEVLLLKLELVKNGLSTSTIDTVTKDAADLREVALLILNSDMRGALRKAHCMDTLARDSIPADVYSFLNGEDV